MKTKTRPKYSTAQSVGFMLKTSWHQHKNVILLSVLIAALTVGLSLAQLFVAPEILHRVETSAPFGELMATIGIFTLLLLVLSTANKYCETCAFVGRLDVRTDICQMILEKNFTTAYPNTSAPHVKKLLAGAQNAVGDNSAAAEHIWYTLTDLMVNLGGFLLYLVLLRDLPPVLMAAVVITSILSFFTARIQSDFVYRHREEWGELWEKVNYISRRSESVELAKDIRIYGLAGWLQDIYGGILTGFHGFIRTREKTFLLVGLADVLLALARNGIAYFYLLRLTLAEGLPASQFLLYFTAVSGFTTWVVEILKGLSQLRTECLDISIVQEYLNYPEPFRFEGGRPIPRAESYELRLEDVSFTYPGGEKPLFQHLDLTIRPGEKLAVVGLNGAGKTSLVKLLCGFYDPDEGRVLLNGQDIREFDRREYYGLLSAVYQDFSLMDTTIAENIACSTQDIDLDRVRHCLDQAGLGDFVASLPRGLDTPVGREVYLDGVLFSGGQTQRLILARALYKDGPILVLDEPTAALDPIAENDIYMKYSDMTHGKTSLFISHRLASTRFCDRIIFLSDGEIAEEGTHEELLARGGAYAQLFEIQARYYQEGREFR